MIKMFLSSMLILLSLNSFASSSLYTYDCTLDEGRSNINYFHITVESQNEITVNKTSSYKFDSEIEFNSMFYTEEVGTLSLEKGFARGFGFFKASLFDEGEESLFTCSLDWSPY